MPVLALDYAHAHLTVTGQLLDASRKGIGTSLVNDSLGAECVARIGTAIDACFHVRSRRSMFVNGLSPAARNLPVPLGVADDMVEHIIANRTKNTRPRTRLVRAIRDHLRRQTFQGVKGVEKAAALIPIPKFWDSVAREMGHGLTGAQVKAKIAELYRRRNIVVHEGAFDIGDALRPRKVHYYRFVESETRSDIAWAWEFVEAVDRL